MISTTETVAGKTSPTTIKDIEQLCARYEAESTLLEAGITHLEEDLKAVQQKHLARLKRQAGVVARAEAELHAAIEAAPELFKKPRTSIFHGVKIGLANAIGSLTFEDEEYVVARIREQFTDVGEFDHFVKTSYTPRKDALRELTPVQLKKLGCRLEGEGETVVIRRTAGDVKKLIETLTAKMVAAIIKPEGTK